MIRLLCLAFLMVSFQGFAATVIHSDTTPAVEIFPVGVGMERAMALYSVGPLKLRFGNSIQGAGSVELYNPCDTDVLVGHLIIRGGTTNDIIGPLLVPTAGNLKFGAVSPGESATIASMGGETIARDRSRLFLDPAFYNFVVWAQSDDPICHDMGLQVRGGILEVRHTQ